MRISSHGPTTEYCASTSIDLYTVRERGASYFSLAKQFLDSTYHVRTTDPAWPTTHAIFLSNPNPNPKTQHHILTAYTPYMITFKI